MAAATTASTWDAALKQLYRDSNVHKSTYKRRPMFGILPKFEGFTGKNMPLVNVYGNPQGRSATFSNAQGNTTSTKIEDFLLDIVSDYSVATVAGDVVDRTRSNKGAFLMAMKKSIDFAMDSLSDAIETFIPRSGTGAIGQISSGSTVTNQTVTLASVPDSANFEVGMTLKGTTTDGDTLDSGSEVLAGINRSTGVITATSAAWNTVMSSLAAGDYLYVEGDGQNGTGNAYKKITGFQSWLPSSAPGSSDSFFGVNRSVDSRLYGTFHDGSSQTMEDALIDAQSKCAQQGGVPDIGFINHVKMRRLVKELGAKKEHTEVNATSPKGLVANVGYRSVHIQGDLGTIKMIAANKCPEADGFILEKDQWVLFSIGKATKFCDEDGNRILRISDDDGYEVRLVFRGNIACKNPIGSARVTLPS